MKPIAGLALVLMLTLGVAAGYAQQGQPSDGQRAQARTIEELYLSQNVELQILRSQALSNDVAVRMLAVQTIRSMVKEGRISEDNPQAFLILEYLATQERGPNVRNFPMVRKEVANILGEVKTERSKKILVSMVINDSETMVQSEAAFSLGLVGLNPQGEVTEALMWALHRENVKSAPDNNFAFATLLAIERISKSKDGIKRPELLSPLIEVLESNYMSDVKTKARAVLTGLIQS